MLGGYTMVAMFLVDTFLHINKNWIFRVEYYSFMIPIIIPITTIIYLVFY